MQILQAPRRSGKTTSLIKSSALTGAVIVTHSQSMVKHILQRAHEMGLAIPTPLTYREITPSSGRLDGTGTTNVMIDDVDYFIKSVVHSSIKVTGATLTPVAEGRARQLFNQNPYKNFLDKQGDGDIISYEQWVARQYE